MPEAAHVDLGIPSGSLLDDPTGALEGRGITKAARWFTLREPADLANPHLADFARAAAEVARLVRSEQGPRRVGREGESLQVRSTPSDNAT